jgi:hypothetical protein
VFGYEPVRVGVGFGVVVLLVAVVVAAVMVRA